MSVMDITGAAMQLLKSLGIGNTWDLDQGSFILPEEKVDKPEFKRTVTFLDVSGLLSMFGVDIPLDLSAFPSLSFILGMIKDKSSQQGPDTSGRTYYTKEQTKFKNNIITYQRPNQSAFIYQWGTKPSRISVTMLLAGGDYLNKLKYLSNLLSTNLEFQGGTLKHPLYGELNGVFVESFSVISSSETYNASLVSVNFITSDVYSWSGPPAKSMFEAVMSCVSMGMSGLQALSNIMTMKSRIMALLGPALAVPSSFGFGSELEKQTDEYFDRHAALNPVENYNSHLDFRNGKVKAYFDTSIGFDKEGEAGVAANASAASENIALALNKLEQNNLDIDYDLKRNFNIITELITSTLDIQVMGYGTGAFSYKTTTTYTTEDILDLEKEESYINDEGYKITIVRQVKSYNNGKYTIEQIKDVEIPVRGINQISYIRSLIDNFILVCSAYSIIYPQDYWKFSKIITNMENLFLLLTRERTQLTTLSQRTSVVGFTENIPQFLTNNSQLVGCRPLNKGMKVFK